MSSGMEQLIFSEAYYDVADFNNIAEFFKNLHRKGKFSIDEFDEEKGKLKGSFIQPYPKNHWNPLAKSPTAMQVIGSASVNSGVFKLETMTKSGLKKVRNFIEDELKEAIEFKREEFINPLDKFKK